MSRLTSEVMRFRVARAPQRRCKSAFPSFEVTRPDELVDWLAAAELASAFLAERGLAAGARRFNADVPSLPLLRSLDCLLLTHGDEIEPGRVQHELRELADDAELDVVLEMWAPLRGYLSAVLVAAVLGAADPGLRVDLTRLLLVIGLVELLTAAPAVLHSAEDVLLALSRRDVVLPADLVVPIAMRQSILARPPGFSDLYVVREEWNRYEPGEIAHIENVLLGEAKLRRHERVDETETTETTATARSTLDELDSQTTDRFELQEESQRDVNLAAHVDGKIDTSGQYGPTKIDTHLGGSFDYSVAESEHHALTQATETVTRAVTRVETQVREERVRRTLTRITETNQHTIDNSGDDRADNIAGIYRWVDKIQTVQLFKYPHRLLFEFELPEPGALVRWFHHRPPGGLQNPLPSPFLDEPPAGEDPRPVTPRSIAVQDAAGNVPPRTVDYQKLGSRYHVTGLTPPPSGQVIFQTLRHPEAETDPTNAGKPPQYGLGSVVIPAGLEGREYRIYISATSALPVGGGVAPWLEPIFTQYGIPLPAGWGAGPTGWLEVTIGTDFPSFEVDGNGNRVGNDEQQIERYQDPFFFREMSPMKFRKPISGTVPLQVVTDDCSGLAITIEMWCEPTSAAMDEWRQQTFEIIQGAYWDMFRAHRDELASRQVRAGITIEGSSPMRNREVIREELKRGVIEMLTGEQFLGRGSTTDVALNDEELDVESPLSNLNDAPGHSHEIQFIEQAFEWENITYVLYPYYWAPSKRWEMLNAISSPDAEFDRFLRSGSARVVVPARPGFEFQANLYTISGALWGGGPAPIPGDILYRSVADEIRAQQQPAEDGEPMADWEVRLPTTLVYLEPVGTGLPLPNPNPKLPV